MLSCFNSWNPSDNYMCSKLCWKKQKTPFRNQNHIKREVKLAMTHNENITFYLASFSNYKCLFHFKVMENVHHIGFAIFVIKIFAV